MSPPSPILIGEESVSSNASSDWSHNKKLPEVSPKNFTSNPVPSTPTVTAPLSWEAPLTSRAPLRSRVVVAISTSVSASISNCPSVLELIDKAESLKRSLLAEFKVNPVPSVWVKVVS